MGWDERDGRWEMRADENREEDHIIICRAFQNHWSFIIFFENEYINILCILIRNSK